MEARLLRIDSHCPLSILCLSHRINLAADIYSYLLGIREACSELNAEVRIDLRIFTSGSIC